MMRLLEEAPSIMNGKDADAKTAHAKKVFLALERFTDKQISEAVDGIPQEPGDILLKYVYRGLEDASDNNASLFKWQAKLTDKLGVGGVVRALTDRKTV